MAALMLKEFIYDTIKWNNFGLAWKYSKFLICVAHPIFYIPENFMGILLGNFPTWEFIMLYFSNFGL